MLTELALSKSIVLNFDQSCCIQEVKKTNLALALLLVCGRVHIAGERVVSRVSGRCYLESHFEGELKRIKYVEESLKAWESDPSFRGLSEIIYPASSCNCI